MPPAARDYTDSEDEGEASDVLNARDGPSTMHPPSSPRVSLSGDKGDSAPHPLRITLRPSLHHLVNDPPPDHSDRSSLSPPPPITLRLGRTAVVERANYSSSDEDEPSNPPIKEEQHEDRPHPSKKAKKSPKLPHSKSSSTSNNSGKSKIHPPVPAAGAAGPSMPAPHRKAYDWLAPSSAAASHHGPPERKSSVVSSGAEGELEEFLAPQGPVEVKKKSHKKRPADAPPGPGKAWRRGLKKGMQIPWKEGGTFMGQPGGPAIMIGSPPYREGSLDSSPEPFDAQSVQEDPLPIPMTMARAPSQEFIPADAEKLGFPVFAKPIFPPKIPLGAFPKVTQFFAPINGGHTVFPRKEKVRVWKPEERIITGIGGGQLKYKTYSPGPSSELGRLIQADREAKELQRAMKKDKAAAEKLDAGERPPLTTNVSFDSNMTPPEPIKIAATATEDGDVEVASELGDGEESVAGSEATPATKPKKKSKAKPRKSKLAQEIIPVEVDTTSEMAVEA